MFLSPPIIRPRHQKPPITYVASSIGVHAALQSSQQNFLLSCDEMRSHLKTHGTSKAWLSFIVCVQLQRIVKIPSLIQDNFKWVCGQSATRALKYESFNGSKVHKTVLTFWITETQNSFYFCNIRFNRLTNCNIYATLQSIASAAFSYRVFFWKF